MSDSILSEFTVRNPPKRVGIICPGGASPATNTAIYWTVKFLRAYGIEAMGIPYSQVFKPSQVFFPLEVDVAMRLRQYPGTFLPTKRVKRDEILTQYATANLDDNGIDALVVIGGSGSIQLVHDEMIKWGRRVVLVPKTIDNDIPSVDRTLGFDSVVEGYVEELLGILHDAGSYADPQLIIYEVMGRDCGWIAVRTASRFFERVDEMTAGMADGVGRRTWEFAGRVRPAIDWLLIPEVTFDQDALLANLDAKLAVQPQFVCVLMAEGTRPMQQQPDEAGSNARAYRDLNEGASARLVDEFKKRFPRVRARCIIPSIAGRAAPVAESDRELAALLSSAAVHHLTRSGHNDQVLAATWHDQVVILPIADVAEDHGRETQQEWKKRLRAEFEQIALRTRQDSRLFHWENGTSVSGRAGNHSAKPMRSRDACCAPLPD